MLINWSWGELQISGKDDVYNLDKFLHFKTITMGEILIQDLKKLSEDTESTDLCFLLGTDDTQQGIKNWWDPVQFSVNNYDLTISIKF